MVSKAVVTPGGARKSSISRLLVAKIVSLVLGCFRSFSRQQSHPTRKALERVAQSEQVVSGWPWQVITTLVPEGTPGSAGVAPRLSHPTRKAGDATRWAKYLLTKTQKNNTLRNLGGVALCCLALTGCITTNQAQNRTIHNDDGGYVVDYALKLEQYRDSGEEIRILGRCDSACTLYLSLPNICVGRNASFSFHKPWGARREVIEMMQAYMMEQYPEWVRQWIKSKGGLGRHYIVLRGKQLRRHLRRCV